MLNQERDVNHDQSVTAGELNTETFGSRLRSERGKHGFSVRQAAQLSGISSAYLNQIERGIKKNPSVDIIKELSRVYDINPQELVELVRRERDSELWSEVITKAEELHNLSDSREEETIIVISSRHWYLLTRQEKQFINGVISRLLKLQKLRATKSMKD